MGFFSRLGQVIKGTASNTVAGLENAHPAAVYEAAIQERERQYGDLKKAMAGLVFTRDNVSKELAEVERELARLRPSLAVAVDGAQDEAALVLLERQETLEAKRAGLQVDLSQLDAQVKESSAGLLRFKDEVARLKREKTEMLARNASAEARIKVQETVDGLSTDADVRGLASVREHIQAITESAGAPELREVQDDMARLRAKAQLDAMKRKLRGQPVEDLEPGSAPGAQTSVAQTSGAQPDEAAPATAEEPAPGDALKRTL